MLYVYGFCAHSSLDKLPFQLLVVARADDVWVSLERARLFAYRWESEFVTWAMQATPTRLLGITAGKKDGI